MTRKMAATHFAIAPRTRGTSMLVMALIIGTVLPGCASFRNSMSYRHRDPMAGAPRLRNASNPHIDEVVTHLNENTNRIQAWRANNVKIHANQWSLSGSLAVEKGRRVRLVVSSPLGNEVDMGSNDERFWIWSRRMEPAFVTCKHENLEAARQQYGIPFEPDWLMQALGVAPLPTTGLKMELDPTNQQARLVEQIVSAHGQPLRRVVLVDLKMGIVLEHSLYAYDGSRVALAKLSGHRTDKTNGIDVVLPRRVQLDCPQNQMSMTMDLGKIQINPGSIPSIVWDMPPMSGCEVVNLDAGVQPHRVAIRPESAVRLHPIETARPFDEEEQEEDVMDPSREERDFESGPDLSGRAKLSDGPVRFAPPHDEEDDWTK